MAHPSADTPPLSPRSRATLRRLSPPTQAVALCERELVLRSLDLARGVRLTVVVGPPGYGKTTLMAQWWQRLRGRGLRAAWYSASGLDRDPGVFLKMLATALVSSGIGLGTDIERAIGDSGAEVTLDGIVFALEQSDTPTVVIIDEFERVDHPPVTSLIDELVHALPEGVHLALASRIKPSLSLSLLRAQGGMRLIEANELRLGTQELAQILALPADSDEVAQVAEHTEGWPVAVQLYRLWRQRFDREGPGPGFTGRATEVGDYLAEQVFSALSSAHQSLLKDLSIVDYCEATLADCIRDTDDSAWRLEEICELLPELVQQSHLGNETAYRLHPLVSEYAQGLLQRDPPRAALLHCRAARWLWQHERYADAIAHAVTSREEQTLSGMLHTLPFFEIFLRFGASELRTLLREIPVECRDRWPRLQMVSALAHFKAGFFDEAMTMLNTIRAHSQGYRDQPGDPPGRLECEGLALELLFTVYIHGIAADCPPRVRRICELAPDTPLMWAWCENVILVVQQDRGELSAARNALVRTRETYEASGIDEFGAQHLVVHELLLQLAAGTLGEVSESANAILRTPPRQLAGERVLGAMARIAQAAVDYTRHYHTRSADAIRLALDQFGGGEAWYDQYAIAIPVMVDSAFRRHGIEAALRELEALRTRLARLGVRSVDDLLNALEVSCHLRAANPAAARRLAQRSQLDAVAEAARPDIPWRTRGLAITALVQLALAEGQAGRAIELARQLINEGRSGGRAGTEIKGLVLLARAQDATGSAAGAGEHLVEAIRLAFSEGFLTPFAEEGPAILPLLKHTAAGSLTAYEQRHVEAVIAALERDSQFDDPNALNEREAEIVAHLADGASNKLIARRLGLTDNTIKYHLKKIYAKLGVSSRKAAVARALRDREAD